MDKRTKFRQTSSGQQYTSSILRLTSLFFILVVTISFFSNTFVIVFARTSTEIGQDIIDKQNEIAENERRLAQSQSNKDYYENEAINAAEGIPRMEAELKQVEEELNILKLQIKLLEEQQNLKELQKERAQFSQNAVLKNSYMEWKSTSHDVRSVLDTENDTTKIQQYQTTVVGGQKVSIFNLTGELDQLEDQMVVLTQKKVELDEKQQKIENRKRDLENRLAQAKWGVNFESGNIKAYDNAVKQARVDLDMLSAEQQAAMRKEQEILEQNPGVTNSAGCDGASVSDGSFYFCGNGRDLYQGHGVGMSQYGAKGGAEQGANSTQILELYYPGALVTTVNEPEEITVRYCQGNPALAPFQENCMYGGSNWGPVVTERINFIDYLAGLGEMPYSWPAEARKAQIVAARTFALKRTNYGDPNVPICLTSYCQVSYVKNNQSHERSLAVATQGQVIMYNGVLIDALYSADNSQNNGTADYDTRFQNIYGNPNGSYPYLKSANDQGWAWNSRMYWTQHCGSHACGLWPWKTRTYTFTEFDQFLNWVGANRYWEFGAAKNAIGNTSYINFERDPSGRIKKVIIFGTNGSYTLGGWWFKNAWIEWTAATGQYDYIYSQTLNIVQ